MKSFLAYQDLKEAVGPHSFEAIQTALSLYPARRPENIVSAIKTISAALGENQVYGPEVNEFKSTIMYELERAYDKARDEELYSKARAMPVGPARSKFFDDYDPPSLFGAQSVKKLLAHFQKHAAQMPKMLKVVQGLAEYKDIMDKLKTITVKGKRPAPVDPAKAKKIASYDVIKEVAKYLTEAAEGVRKQLYDATLAHEKRNIETLKKSGIVDYNSYYDFMKKAPQLQLLMQSVYDIGGTRYQTNRPYTLKPQAELDAIAVRNANIITNDIIAQFVAKNTQKLSLIVQRKKAIKAHKILTNRVREGVLENQMFFEFDDNSSFKIYSKVEYAYSPKGKLFMRMPTRFTDVTMPDGSRMKGAASEERMTTEF